MLATQDPRERLAAVTRTALLDTPPEEAFDRLTRMASVRPRWRGLRNTVLSTLSHLPPLRRQLAWRLSGLIYRVG